MFHVQQNIFIDAPVSACAAFLANPQNLPVIDRKVGEMDVLSMANDQAEVILRGRFAGFIPYDLKLNFAFKPEGGFVAKGKSGILRTFHTEFTLEPHGARTNVIHIESYDFLFSRIAEFFFRPTVERIVTEELTLMKGLVEMAKGTSENGPSAALPEKL